MRVIATILVLCVATVYGRRGESSGRGGGRFGSFEVSKFDGRPVGGSSDSDKGSRGRNRGSKNGSNNMVSFNTWCTDSWQQKRSCVQAAQSVRAAADLVRDAAVLDEVTGEYTVDVVTALSGTAVLATNLTGYVEYDGPITGFVDVSVEDEEFWRSIRHPGFNYLWSAEGETFSFSSMVKVRPARPEDETDPLADEEDPEEVQAMLNDAILDKALSATGAVETTFDRRGGGSSGRGGRGKQRGLAYILSVSVPIAGLLN